MHLHLLHKYLIICLKLLQLPENKKIILTEKSDVDPVIFLVMRSCLMEPQNENKQK